LIDITKRSYLKYILFGNIYLANGLQGSLALVIIILYFTEKDISIAATTMVTGVRISSSAYHSKERDILLVLLQENN